MRLQQEMAARVEADKRLTTGINYFLVVDYTDRSISPRVMDGDAARRYTKLRCSGTDAINTYRGLIVATSTSHAKRCTINAKGYSVLGDLIAIVGHTKGSTRELYTGKQ